MGGEVPFGEGTKALGGPSKGSSPQGGGGPFLVSRSGERPLKGTYCVLVPERGTCWVTLAKGRGGSAPACCPCVLEGTSR